MIVDVALLHARQAFHGYLERTADTEIAIGRGIAIPIRGWLRHDPRLALSMHLHAEGWSVPIIWKDDLRPDLIRRTEEGRWDASGLFGGFWGLLRLPGGASLPELARLDVALSDGEHASYQIPLPKGREGPLRPAEKAPPLAICLATYQPELSLLERQIASLRAQSAEDWVCFVQDDASEPDRYRELMRLTQADRRFIVARNSARLGFVNNFGAALARVPAGTSLVALCDQDDWWHPDKLQQTIDALGRFDLCYCDSRAVDAFGQELAPSMQAALGGHRPSLANLLLGNLVTGAACVFRGDLLDLVLPLPQLDGVVHDHWLAVCAAASRGIKQLPRVLYDYTQHGDNAIGFPTASQRPWPRWMHLRSFSLAGARRHDTHDFVRCGYELYYGDAAHWRQVVALAETLRLRCPGQELGPVAAAARYGMDRLTSLLKAASCQAAHAGQTRELAWAIGGRLLRRQMRRHRQAWTELILAHEVAATKVPGAAAAILSLGDDR
ncbi:MAG: glycosyltransferase [Proteobacteria bacterium]|nr:glycosyltransferase [Pseudomonadota bacterium]MBI3498489.1 glycosyltransferase [Pseudomonadota bacterium]